MSHKGGISSPAPLMLCLMDMTSWVGRTDIPFMPILKEDWRSSSSEPRRWCTDGELVYTWVPTTMKAGIVPVGRSRRRRSCHSRHPKHVRRPTSVNAHFPSDRHDVKQRRLIPFMYQILSDILQGYISDLKCWSGVHLMELGT